MSYFLNNYTRLASISIKDWIEIHAYCRRYDVESGLKPFMNKYLFDAPMGGAIHVWDAEYWEIDLGYLHCTFYPDRSDQKHPGEILEEVIESNGELSFIPGFVGGAQWVDIYFDTGSFEDVKVDIDKNGEIIYSWERNWNSQMGKEFFVKLFKEVTGNNYENK